MKQRTTMILLISGLTAFSLVVVYWVAYSSLLSTNASVISTEVSLNDATANKDKLKALKKTISDSSSDIQRLDGMFLDKDGVASFLQQVESLADLSGVTHSLSPDIQQDGTLATRQKELLKISLNTTGSWVGTYRFLNLLENLPYKIAFSNVSIQSGEGDKVGGSVWTGSFQFTVVKNQ